MHTTAKQSLVELKRKREQVAVRKETVATSSIDFYCNGNHYILRSVVRQDRYFKEGLFDYPFHCRFDEHCAKTKRVFYAPHLSTM